MSIKLECCNSIWIVAIEHFLLLKVGAEFKLFLPDHILPTKQKKKGPLAEKRLPKGCAKQRKKVIELALGA